jgi:hypothetical protein
LVGIEGGSGVVYGYGLSISASFVAVLSGVGDRDAGLFREATGFCGDADEGSEQALIAKAKSTAITR